jgi:hypothetical protein
MCLSESRDDYVPPVVEHRDVKPTSIGYVKSVRQGGLAQRSNRHEQVVTCLARENESLDLRWLRDLGVDQLILKATNVVHNS